VLRPFQVCLMDLETREERVLFTDEDPTHYVDISVTKDKRYLIINNNTKEDSEIWVLDRNSTLDKPIKLISRKDNCRSYVDHLRDFFIVITNENVESQNFKLATLSDEVVSQF